MENTQRKESNFVSVVGYLHDSSAFVQKFLEKVTGVMQRHFDHYEVILVDDCCRDDSVEQVRAFVSRASQNVPVTIVTMSVWQGMELGMNAGVDISVGDFVFEFDSLEIDYEPELIFQAYQKALTGYDIVTVGPVKNRSFSSSLFYRVFNASSGSRYPIQTDVFRMLSRRAVNRVRAVSPTPAYRKAAYAACGLKAYSMRDERIPHTRDVNEALRFSLAADSLVLYTNAGYRLSCGIAGLMLLATLLEFVYTLVIYLGGGKPIEGWTTTMLVLTLGFFGVFLILAVVMRYLTLLVDLVFKHQRYLVEGIEKIQKEQSDA